MHGNPVGMRSSLIERREHLERYLIWSCRVKTSVFLMMALGVFYFGHRVNGEFTLWDYREHSTLDPVAFVCTGFAFAWFVFLQIVKRAARNSTIRYFSAKLKEKSCSGQNGN